MLSLTGLRSLEGSSSLQVKDPASHQAKSSVLQKPPQSEIPKCRHSPAPACAARAAQLLKCSRFLILLFLQSSSPSSPFPPPPPSPSLPTSPPAFPPLASLASSAAGWCSAALAACSCVQNVFSKPGSVLSRECKLCKLRCVVLLCSTRRSPHTAMPVWLLERSLKPVFAEGEAHGRSCVHFPWPLATSRIPNGIPRGSVSLLRLLAQFHTPKRTTSSCQAADLKGRF